MESARIEAWTLAIIDRLKAKQPIEDVRVELKREWIAPGKAARRIAGHANAARGEEILWLIGVDDRNTEAPVLGVDVTEFSSWWNQTRSQFVELAPDLRELNVPTEGRTVVALWMDTTRAPFVVKNERRGDPEGGVAETEVPWREGTAVRSARRSDLIRVLVPATSIPEPQVTSCQISFELNPHKPHEARYQARMGIYLRMSIDGRVLVFPDHDARAECEIEGETVALRDITLHAPPGPGRGYGTPLAQTSERGAGQLLVRGAGPVYVRASAWPEVGPMVPQAKDPALLRVHLRAIEAARPIVTEMWCDCAQDHTDDGGVRRVRWTMPVC